MSVTADDFGDLDDIGPWSEIKLEIIQKYAHAYSVIMTKQREKTPRFSHMYVDAFAGAGQHISRSTGGLVRGSPLIALETNPPFSAYYFIDIQERRIRRLEELAHERPDVYVRHGDANEQLTRIIHESIHYERYERALVLLDPYTMHYNWSTVAALGQTRAVDVFLHFPTMAMNRYVLRRNPEEISQAATDRMNLFWGNDTWRQSFFQPSPQLNLFGTEVEEKTATNLSVVNAYRERLRTTAGFRFVPEALVMRNSVGAELYYLIFATHNRTAGDAGRIVEQIFANYR